VCGDVMNHVCIYGFFLSARGHSRYRRIWRLGVFHIAMCDLQIWGLVVYSLDSERVSINLVGDE